PSHIVIRRMAGSLLPSPLSAGERGRGSRAKPHALGPPTPTSSPPRPVARGPRPPPLSRLPDPGEQASALSPAYRGDRSSDPAAAPLGPNSPCQTETDRGASKPRHT